MSALITTHLSVWVVQSFIFDKVLISINVKLSSFTRKAGSYD